MCKLAFIKTKDGSAYRNCVDMIKFQEHVVAGHSTGVSYLDNQGFHIRKAVGKVNSFLDKYPDTPSTNYCLGHSRYATVGAINLDNQHPIPIIVNGKTIGYGVHNGTFNAYESYEYLRSDMNNKTDSALLFTMFAKMLQKMGDNPLNRRIAFGYIMSLIVHEANHNLIILFRNGKVMFSGNALTYKKKDNIFAIMTFGFANVTNDSFIYEVAKGFDLNKYKIIKPPFRFKAKPPKHKKTREQHLRGLTCDYNQAQLKRWYE